MTSLYLICFFTLTRLFLCGLCARGSAETLLSRYWLWVSFWRRWLKGWTVWRIGCRLLYLWCFWCDHLRIRMLRMGERVLLGIDGSYFLREVFLESGFLMVEGFICGDFSFLSLSETFIYLIYSSNFYLNLQRSNSTAFLANPNPLQFLIVLVYHNSLEIVRHRPKWYWKNIKNVAWNFRSPNRLKDRSIGRCKY